MWRGGRDLARSFCSPCCFYSSIRRPTVHLHNSTTKAKLLLVGIDHVSSKRPCRDLARSFCSPRCFYSSIRRPTVHLHNSTTKAKLLLVGIDHVSSKSAEFVRKLIRDVQPNVVAVELCEERGKTMLSGQVKLKKLKLWDFFAIKGSLTQKLLTFIIQNLYAELAGTGLRPGEELRVAIEQGDALGASISYIDQNMNVTLERAGQGFYLTEAFRFFMKRKEIARKYPNFFGALSYEDIDDCAEAMMNPEALNEAVEMGEKYFPGLVKAILHERNEYMVKNLREMEGSIVGVVGALHIQGMHKLWREAEFECFGRE